MPDLWVTKEGTASKVTFLLPLLPIPISSSPPEERRRFFSIDSLSRKEIGEKGVLSDCLSTRTGKADASWNSNRPRPPKKMQEAICHRVKRYHPITSRSPKKGEWHTKYFQSGEKRRRGEFSSLLDCRRFAVVVIYCLRLTGLTDCREKTTAKKLPAVHKIDKASLRKLILWLRNRDE